MSLLATIPLKNAAAVIINFVKVKSDNINAYFTRENATVGQPDILQISHQMPAPTNLDAIDRHLAKRSLTVIDSSGKPRTLVVNLTCAVPRQGITETHVKDLLCQIADLVDDPTFVAQFCRGEL